MALISGGILVLMWVSGHDFSGHYNRLGLISVDIISGVYCSSCASTDTDRKKRRTEMPTKDAKEFSKCCVLNPQKKRKKEKSEKTIF